jgi:tetratricopeptide (TPR) repeat protein
MVLGIAVCLAFFALVETGLRVANWPDRSPRDADPFVGFSALQPLFQVNNGMASVAPAKLRFFNAASFPVKKPAKSFRVFCFGGSTTYGHPFDGRTAFSRWLQDLINAASPDTTAEVINAGGISYASYRIVPLVRETLRYQPDLMVIYTGHNEFLERRTYAQLFDQGGTVVAMRSVLEGFNTYQALKKMLVPLVARGTDASKPVPPSHAATGTRSDPVRQSNSVLEEEVTTILDRSAGLDLYHRDEEFARGVVHHFAYNLRAMIRLCRNAGVPVILVEPPCNLKDFSPFKSEHTKGFSLADKMRLEKLQHEAELLIRNNRFADAMEILDGAITEDPLYAEYYFWKGRALLGLARYPEARDNFVKARDMDVCPLRCISPIQQQIREIAREEQVPLIPFCQVVDRQVTEAGDKSGIPGNESFLDHVHPTIPLHQVAASLILDKMADIGTFPQARGLSAQQRAEVFAKGMNDVDRNFMLLRDLNLAKTLKWAGRTREAREALNRVFEPLDANAEVHKMMGSFLLEEGKYAEAVHEYRRAVELSGNDGQMVFALGNAQYRAGLKQDATDTYRRLLEKDKSIPDAYANMAIIKLESGKVRDAKDVLQAGLKEHPDAATLFAPYGLAHALSGNYSEALVWQRRAVAAEPGDPKHLYNLAGMYCLSGDVQEALRHLNLAIDRGYTDAEKLRNDSIFSAIREKPEFQKILSRIR